MGDERPELVCTYAGQFVRDVHYRKWNGETLGPVQTLVEQSQLGRSPQQIVEALRMC